MAMRPLLLGAAVVALAMPAAAEIRGFNPDSVRARIGAGEATAVPSLSEAARSRVPRLDRTAQALRLNLARDPAALLALLDEDERATATGVLSDGSSEGWRYFFAGSTVLVGGIEAETVRVGFYNPMVDGFVLVDLHDTGASFRLTGMQAMTGAAMRGDAVAADAAPGWVRVRGQPAPVAMVEAAGAAAGAFERRYPMSSNAPAPLAGTNDRLVADRSALSVSLISTVLDYPEWSTVLSAFDPRLRPDAGLARHPAVAALPEVAQRDLRLGGVIRGESDSMATFYSPAAPRLVLFVDMKGGAGDTRPELGRAALVDVLASRSGN